MRKRLVATCLVLVASLTMPAVGSAAEPRPQGRAVEVVPGSYIVTLQPGVEPVRGIIARLARAGGFSPRHRYQHAVRGFSARLSRAQVEKLRAAPEVAAVTANRLVHLTGALVEGDVIPAGVRRIGPRNPIGVAGPSSVNVAVIDTGIDLDHPDLNAVHGVNCVGGVTAEDDHGHGTHVAGVVGAKNNGVGVTGVAPGTKLYAVKVMTPEGGSIAEEICGLDWVTSTRTDDDPTNDIAIANMSLGGAGPPVQTCATTTDPEHQAVCRATAAGVTIVAAAGNDSWDFDHPTLPDLPAAFPEVLTVTSIADTDGIGGALGRACGSDEDDSYAAHSNYASTPAGAAHILAAPGVCVRSTYINDDYTTMTGTSMAAPHVAGVAALCIEEAGVPGLCAGQPPGGVRDTLRDLARRRRVLNDDYGFIGDPHAPIADGSYGYLTTVPNVDLTPPVVESVSPTHGAMGVAPSTTVSVTFSEAMDKASAEAAFSLAAYDTEMVRGAFSWSGRTMKFKPSVRLPVETSYDIRIASTAKDLAGYPLDLAFHSGFQTWQLANSTPYAVARTAGSWLAGNEHSLTAVDKSTYRLASTTRATKRTGFVWNSGAWPEAVWLKVKVATRYSRTCAQTVSVYRRSTKSWVKVHTRKVGTTQVTITASMPGAPSQYISPTGNVRGRIACSTSAGTFRSYANMVKLQFAG